MEKRTQRKIPKGDFQCICLSVILIDSIFRAGNNYYLRVFLEECKYVVKGKRMLKHIIDEIESSCDSDRKDSKEESFDEENVNEEN